MSTINLDDANAHLPEIISGLNPGEQLTIVQDGVPVATLTRHQLAQWPCKAGSAKHVAHRMSPDFDAPLDEFREYLQ
jgi:antitoxin (DNA-binding transcriptional repressor) of toxin-antitoxin stability system